MEYNRVELQDGVTLWVWPTKKFKNITVKICLHQSMSRDVTATALLPFVFSRGTERWPTTRDIAIHMADLYGTQYDMDVMKIGEQQLISVEVEAVNPRYISGSQNLLRDGLEAAVQLAFYPRLEGQTLSGPYVTQEIDMMKKRIASLINNKRSFARQRFYHAMFPDEPYSRYKYGSEEGLDQIGHEGLTSHWQAVLTSAPVNIFVVGDVDSESVSSLLREMVPSGGRKVTDIPETTVISDAREVKVVNEREEVNQAVLFLGYRTGITTRDPLYFASILANGILGGFPHSKLFTNVREKASLAYYASSSVDATKGVLFATAGIDPANYQKTVDIMQEQVADLKKGEISEYEMEATKRGLINWYQSSLDSPTAAINRTLVGLVSGRMLSVDESIEGIAKVGADQIVAAAERFTLDTIYCLTSK